MVITVNTSIISADDAMILLMLTLPGDKGISRIIAIADTYDAMNNERTYRSSLPEEVVIDELRKNAGIQFDPDLVNVFIEKVLVV